MPLTLVVCLALAFVGLANAGDAYTYESAIKVKEPLATTGNPGSARFKTKTRFSSIEMLCLHVFFDASDPLDPGEQLSFYPTSLPHPNGPGMVNVGTEPQYSRTLCNVSYPEDIFIPPFLDGKETFLLDAVGSVLITRIDVEVFGSADVAG